MKKEIFTIMGFYWLELLYGQLQAVQKVIIWKKA